MDVINGSPLRPIQLCDYLIRNKRDTDDRETGHGGRRQTGAAVRLAPREVIKNCTILENAQRINELASTVILAAIPKFYGVGIYWLVEFFEIEDEVCLIF